VFDWTDGPLQFAIDASVRRPIRNLCLEIGDWPGPATRAQVAVDGVERPDGPECRQAVRIARDGSWTLVVWLELSADEPRRFTVTARTGTP
jgi:hypothetical protein